MDTRRAVARAELVEIRWDDDDRPEPVNSSPSKNLTVQFNPASLKVTYTNQVQSNDQSTSSALQFVGKGSSKLSVELIFDVSGANATHTRDVREMTRKVAAYMQTTAEGSGETRRYRVPGARFQWGSFVFDGVVESMDETLELWSEDGYPLRATVVLSLSQPGIHHDLRAIPNGTAPPAGATQAGARPLTPAQAGVTLQGMVAAAGQNADWRAVAEANGIENPRFIPPGALLDLGRR